MCYSFLMYFEKMATGEQQQLKAKSVVAMENKLNWNLTCFQSKFFLSKNYSEEEDIKRYKKQIA